MRILITIVMSMFFVSCASKQKATTAAPAPAAKVAPKSAKAEASVAGKVTCTKDKETRTLEVATVDKGCELNYTKSGDTKKAATSVHGSDYCQKVSDKIKGHLVASGYSCN